MWLVNATTYLGHHNIVPQQTTDREKHCSAHNLVAYNTRGYEQGLRNPAVCLIIGVIKQFSTYHQSYKTFFAHSHYISNVVSELYLWTVSSIFINFVPTSLLSHHKCSMRNFQILSYYQLFCLVAWNEWCHKSQRDVTEKWHALHTIRVSWASALLEYGAIGTQVQLFKKVQLSMAYVCF